MADTKSVEKLSRGRAVAFTGLALFFALIAGEATLAVLGATLPRVQYLLSPESERRMVPDAQLGHRFSPYSAGHDSRGYRNPDGVDRAAIAAIGDSYTYGWGARGSESWPHVLGAKTGRSVYNAGIVGYGFCEYSQVVDELLILQPETVVLGIFTGNDLGDTYRAVYVDGRCPHLMTRDEELLAGLRARDALGTIAEEAERLGWGSETPAVGDEPPRGVAAARRWMSESSSIYGLMREIRRALSPQPVFDFASASQLPHRHPWAEKPALRTVFKSPEMFMLTVDLDDPRISEGLRIAAQALVMMRERLSANGVDLRVVIIPEKFTVYEPFATPGEGLPESFFEMAARDRLVAAAFAEHLEHSAIPFIDVTGALQARAAEQVAVFPETDDHHNNAEGYRVIATEVAERLLAGHR